MLDLLKGDGHTFEVQISIRGEFAYTVLDGAT